MFLYRNLREAREEGCLASFREMQIALEGSGRQFVGHCFGERPNSAATYLQADHIPSGLGADSRFF